MAYLLTDDEHQLQSETRRFLDARNDGATARALLEGASGATDPSFWADARAMGWTGITAAEEWGGLAMPARAFALVAEECGRRPVAAPWLAHGFVVAEALRRFASDAVRSRLLPGVASGETTCAHHLEGGGVSFAGGRVHGRLAAVPGGAEADLLLAVVDGAPWVIDLSAAERTPFATIDGSRGYADLLLHGAGADPLDGGAEAVLDLRSRLVIAHAWEAIGGSGWCLETTCRYAGERIAFGQPIGAFQAIKHGLAEMYVAIELARAAAMDAVEAMEADAPDLPLRAAAARIGAIAAYGRASRDAIQFHGGIGVTWEHHLHVHYRRARALATEAGSCAEWQDLCVDLLG